MLKFNQATLKGLTCLAFFFLMVGFSLSLLVLAPSPQSGQNCISNIAIWETNTSALNVTPCTVDAVQTFNGKQYFVQYGNLTWKGAPNTIDIAFKFDKTMPNSGLDLWQNISHPYAVSNCTESKQQFSNATNSSLYNVSTFTCSPFTNQNFYFDWVSKNALINHMSHSTGEYYAITNIPVVTGQLFQSRLKFAKADVPLGTTLKWGLFGKLNSDSIQTALSTGRYSELDPTINSTAYNITSNSDLNLTVSTAYFVDGKLIAAAASNGNITGWDTFSDNELRNNPAWTSTNLSGGTAGESFSVRGEGGFLNITSNDGASHNSLSVMRVGNLSIGEATSGIVVSFYLNKNLLGVSDISGSQFSVCFMYDFLAVSNGTGASGNCGTSTAAGGGKSTYYRWTTSNLLFRGDRNAGTVNGETQKSSAVAIGSGVEHWEFFVNSTSTRLIINRTEGGTLDTGGGAISAGYPTTSGGQVMFSLLNDAGGIISSIIDNVTVYNATDIGKPNNLTSGRFETNLLNATASVTSVYVRNQTEGNGSYANTAATWYALDNDSKGQTVLTEGAFTTIDPANNGLKINATFTNSNVYTASEFNSVFVQFNAPAAPLPTIVNNNSNTTAPQVNQVVGYSVNVSGTSLEWVNVSSNITGSETNVSIPLSGSTGNVTANFTVNLKYSGTSSVNTTYFSIRVTDANGATTSNKAKFTINNTPPTVPIITFPTSNINTNNNQINFTGGLDADGSAVTIALYVNSSINQTSTGANFTIAATPERNYVINISATDGFNTTTNASVSYQFDNLSARIDNGSNSINTSRFISVSSADVNYTFTEFFNATIYIRNGTGGVVTNTSPVQNQTYFRFNFTALNDGNYTFSAWINDTAGNVGTSANISVTVDTTVPVPIFSSATPSNATYISNPVVNLSFNVSDANFKNLTVSIYNASGTLLNESHFLVPNSSLNYTLNDAAYMANITARDQAGNVNTSVS